MRGVVESVEIVLSAEMTRRRRRRRKRDGWHVVRKRLASLWRARSGTYSRGDLMRPHLTTSLADKCRRRPSSISVRGVSSKST